MILEVEYMKHQNQHTIDIVIDRLVIKDSIKSRLTDSVSLALLKSKGLVNIDVIGGKELIFSEKLACAQCNLSFEEITPRIFSFNNPYGACERCSGLGFDFIIDADLVVPDKTKSINQGAIYPWSKSVTSYYTDLLKGVSDYYNINLDTPFNELSKEEQIMLNKLMF